MLTFLTEKDSLPVFPYKLGHYYSYEESEKKAFESTWNTLLAVCHQILAKANSLGYTGHQISKKNSFFNQNSFSWITFF